jgi:hypothetical protein
VTRIAYYGVVQDGNSLAVVGYDLNCQPATKPIKRFPMGVDGMLKALGFAASKDGELK